jgi:hypothetical protein
MRDTTNNLEFLRLDITMDYGFNGVVAQTGFGDNFYSWNVATTAQMENLGRSAGVYHHSTDPAQIAIVESMRDWFCPIGTCERTTTTHETIRGLVAESGSIFPSGNPSQLAFSMGRRFNVTPNEVAFRISGHGSLTALNEEIWMVRVVPIPAAAWLFVSGITGLGLVSRRKRKMQLVK